MDKIINSLFLVSMISSPINKINFSKIYTPVSNRLKNEVRQIRSDDINQIIIDIDDNFSVISSLLSEKNRISKSIKNSFENKIKTKQILSKEQMDSFKASNDMAEEEENNISTYSEKLKNKKEFLLLENELLSSANNFSIIYNKLNNVLNYQMNLIASLYKAIFHLRVSLAVL